MFHSACKRDKISKHLILIHKYYNRINYMYLYIILTMNICEKLKQISKDDDNENKLFFILSQT